MAGSNGSHLNIRDLMKFLNLDLSFTHVLSIRLLG